MRGGLRNIKTLIDSKVSVIIPTFNRSGLLARAVESVVRQTYSNLEILIVDDASDDDTPAIVRQFADRRIHYIRHAANQGGAATRNTGIEAASGKYIAFLDDDDEWEPEKTEIQLAAMAHYDAVICTSDRQKRNLKRYSEKKVVDLDDLRRGKFTGGGTGALMAKAGVLREIMFDEELRKNQDWDLFIRIARKYSIGYLNKPFVRYNEGDHERITNLNRDRPIRDVEKQLVMLNKHKEFFGKKWFNRHMSRALVYGIRNRRDKVDALFYIVRKFGAFNVSRVIASRAGFSLRKAMKKLRY